MSAAGLSAQLRRGIDRSGSALCIGLDPDPERIPASLGTGGGAIERFCTEIIAATSDLACAYKPQIAHFAGQRAERELEVICAAVRELAPHALLILDAKRGDIGSTAEWYAREAFDRYAAHAVTVNPYLGTDAALPFLERGGVIALCRTSNPGAGELQDRELEGRPLYLAVAEMVATSWARHGDCGLVVGATAPEQMARIRAVAVDLPFLIPGVGAQGGDLGQSVRAGRPAAGSAVHGAGLMVSSSREILYAASGTDFAEAARDRAVALHSEIARALADGEPVSP